MKSNKKIKEILEDMVKKTEASLSSIAHKSPGEPGGWTSDRPQLNEDGPLDLESETDEVEIYVGNLSLEKQLEKKLNNIKEALARLKKNKYGICVVCGKKINSKRLDVLPEALSCPNCNIED